MNNIALKDEWMSRHSQRNAYKLINNYLYHYTTRENLWNIISSDSFYARHVRFSNDSQEYTLGKREIEDISKKTIANVEDCYMVCFCKENDILSQWREYARGGVSLMLDFRKDTLFTIKCNEEVEKENSDKRKLGEKSPYFIPGPFAADYCKVFSKPVEVHYITPKDEKLTEAINAIQNFVEHSEEMMEEGYLKSLIPYIKHKGFEEEKEVRIIFDIDSINAPYQVVYLDSAGMKRPCIRVEVGDASQKELPVCRIKYNNISKALRDEIEEKLEEKVETEEHLKKGKLPINVLDDKGNVKKENIQIELEVKLQRKDEKYITISACKYQQQVFQYIDQIISNANVIEESKIKIWCEGHLPIRKITVGPSNDAEELRESIAHKIKNIYWMKYTDVDISKIPYRSK